MKKIASLALALFACSLAVSWPELERPLVRLSDEVECIAGQVIVTLAPETRGQLDITSNSSGARFGISALDELNREFGVGLIAPLMRHKPDPIALKHNCDLQFLVQAGKGVSVAAMLTAYERIPEVASVVPNAWLRLIEPPSPETESLPDDSLRNRQWHLPNIGAEAGWWFAQGDTNVLIAVLDDGCEWHHPDIEPNLWINHPEDINDNGRFDPLPYPDGDLDGIDQDGNGYIDDVIGFDLVAGDPDPDPAVPSDNHGTHCWGTANAATNNALGVSAPPWNVRSFGFRCGGGGGISLYAAIAGVYYTVSKNVWAISMSFGGYSQFQPLRDACQYAWDYGAVLVAGAGNDGRNTMFYPAGYPSVLAIAASGPGDTHTSWSNYGDWIAITAPGDGIYSTLTNHGYGTMSGTSMSTPLVAGVLSWLKSAFPELTNTQACSLMFATADSMPDEYYRNGWLGAGRVSMANVVLPRFHCNLTMTDWRWNDAGGNSNGRPDPGET
ncbi:MAG TPA: hypothetical protein ENN51_07430, partial [candidate division WOR-3 bacterium]|nr:hypothetical protein [candidate division WOR-3 bacterium]